MTLSKLGATLSAMYLLIAIGLVIYAYLCAGNYCGLVAVREGIAEATDTLDGEDDRPAE